MKIRHFGATACFGSSKYFFRHRARRNPIFGLRRVREEAETRTFGGDRSRADTERLCPGEQSSPRCRTSLDPDPSTATPHFKSPMPKPRSPRRHAVSGPAAQRNLCAERIGRGTAFRRMPAPGRMGSGGTCLFDQSACRRRNAGSSSCRKWRRTSQWKGRYRTMQSVAASSGPMPDCEASAVPGRLGDVPEIAGRSTSVTRRRAAPPPCEARRRRTARRPRRPSSPPHPRP